MRRGLLRFGWIGALATAWGLTWSESGWVQDRKPAASVSKTAAPAANRSLEIQVELAWLADPVTFPYYLEAVSKGSQLEVRGYVPSKAVGDHALRLARLNCPLTIVDATREHKSLSVKTTRLAPEKLNASVRTALSQALPVTHKALRVECAADGKVVVSGEVRSLEEKLAVSQSLRRLHGCAYVVNLTNTAGSPTPRGLADAGSSPRTVDPRTIAPRETRSSDKRPGDIQPVQLKEPVKSTTSRTPDTTEPAPKKDGPFGGFFQRVFGKKTTASAPAREPSREPTTARFPGVAKEPVRLTPVAQPKKDRDLAVPLPKGPTDAGTPRETSGAIVPPLLDKSAKRGKTLSPAQVKTRLETLYPRLRPIQVTSEGGNKLKIELGVRTNEESNEVAGRILSLPELEPFEVNLHLRIDAPRKE